MVICFSFKSSGLRQRHYGLYGLVKNGNLFSVKFALGAPLMDRLQTISYVFEIWEQQQMSLPTVMLSFADIPFVTLSSDMPLSFDWQDGINSIFVFPSCMLAFVFTCFFCRLYPIGYQIASLVFCCSLY